VVVVHAFKLPAGAPPGLDFEDRIAERHAHARPALEALLVVGDDAVLGTAYEIEVLEGSPAPVIAELTACWGADEIIVGARGLGCSHAVLGSVARELLQMADRPVTVVPNAALDQLRNGSSPSSAGDAAAAALV
jgi:nucleotide-binding universal stress UspA family protein